MISHAPGKNTRPRHRGVRELIDDSAQRGPKNIAAIVPDENWSLSYDELKLRVQSVAAWLSSLGLREHDKIAIAAGNCMTALELMAGARYGHLVPVPCNPDLGPEQLAFVLKHCDARHVFATREYLPAVELALKKCPGTIELVEVERRFDLPKNHPCSTDEHPDDDALMIYTSGTTGRPKGVMHSCSSLLASLENTAATYDLSEEDRFLCVLPIHHGNSINKIFATWMTGGTVVLPPRFEVRNFWNWVDQHRCTWLALVPSIISQLLRLTEEGTHPSVRFARSSSAPLPTAWHREFEEKFGLPLMQGMGSTETGPLFSNPLPPEPRKIGSPGKAIVRQEVRIVDPEGNPLPDHKTGMIIARGPSQMKGYHKDPEATASLIKADGWTHTGDLGYRDSEGYFFVTGRAKEIVIKAGVNISLAEIDNTLLSHPKVQDAASAGIEDDYLGEDIVAFVVSKSETALDDSELLDFCVDKLGTFKTPTELIHVDAIPRLPNGKVQRHLLKERYPPPPRPAPKKTPRPATQQAFVAPRTPIETIIARVWARHLRQKPVGIHDNFFALGGYSLLAIRMLTPLRKELGPALSLTTFFEHPTIADQALIATTARIQRLPESERPDLFSELVETAPAEKTYDLPEPGDSTGIESLTLESRIALETALLQRSLEDSREDRIIPRSPAELCPLSYAQQRIWFLIQLSPESTMYNSGDAIRLHGRLDIDALEEALNDLVNRHEVLRTSIHAVDGQPWQKFRSHLRIRILKQNLEHIPQPEQESALEQAISSTLKHPFALDKDPLIRASIIKLKNDDHVFILSRHNLVIDGWSNRILLSELKVAYSDRIHGVKSALPSLPIQYGDFAAWQRDRLNKEKIQRETEYWANRLKDVPTILNLPTDRPRPKVQSHLGHRLTFHLDDSLSGRVDELSRQQLVSSFTTLSAAFATLVYRYSGQTDFVFGIPFADRDRPEIQYVVGLLLDTHVIRFSISDKISFRELLAQTHSEVAESYAHRDMPFELVVDAIQPERSPGHMPLCQVMVNWTESSTRMESLVLEGLSTQALLPHDQTAKFDILINFSASNNGIRIEIEYEVALFEADTVRRMAEHFQRLLEEVTTNPSGPVGKIPLLTENEKRKLLRQWNETAAPYPQDRCIHQLFENQAEKTPDALAVLFEDSQLTYQELNIRANQLAHHLVSLGVAPGMPVGICMERSLGLLVGLLAILKAGGVYVPLDPSYPGKRLSFMLNDTAAPILITQEALLDQIPGHKARTFCLDRDWPMVSSHQVENPSRSLSASSPAYIIYTSGSTGLPKGILLPHATLVNLMLANQSATPGGRVAQFTSISFDVSLQEIFYALVSGNALIVIDNQTRTQPEAFAVFMKTEAITDLFVPNNALHYMLQAALAAELRLPALRNIFQAGEALRITRTIRSFFESHPNCRLHNHYGPAESHVVTTRVLPRDAGKWPDNPSIGQPISNTRIYILDSHQNLLPVGVPGEIHIAGAGLAQAYLNQPALSGRKFVPDPYSKHPGTRMYKTGDLARYLPDGNIEFLGRLDDQVKIRGFRIEPGEIETLLTEHPAVDDALVMAREDPPGSVNLVAYVTPADAKLDEFGHLESLRAELRERLPHYMIPAAYVILESLPLTPNGKIDRLALPAPTQNRTTLAGGMVAPRDSLEELVAGVWREVLELEQIGINDNFFELGGNSLSATQVAVRLAKLVPNDLPLRCFFEAPTVSALALELKKDLRANDASGTSSIPPAPRSANLPLSFAQQRLWFLDRLLPARAGYNMSSVWRLKGALDLEALRRCIELLIQRHEPLRTRFAIHAGEPTQVIDPPGTFAWQVTDVGTVGNHEQKARARAMALEEAQKPIDLEADSLLCAHLMSLSPEEHVLHLKTHHIASDGWSMGIMLRELGIAYDALVQGNKPELPTLAIQYADYALWQRKWLQGDVLESQLLYWKKKLSDLEPLDFPTDRPRKLLSTNQGAQMVVDLPQSLIRGLKDIGRSEGATLFMTLLTAFKILLHRYCGQEDIAVGTPIAGRGHTNLEGLIGFFVNTLVIRDDLSGNPNFRHLLSRVKESALEAYTHQDIPFEKLVEELSPTRDLTHNPLFQVMFILQNAPRSSLDLKGIETTRLPLERHSAKFDLKLSLSETDTGLSATWGYNTELFDRSTIERMAQHFQTLLTGIVAAPDRPIGQIPLLSKPERNQLLHEWNDTRLDYPGDRGVHQIFEHEAKRTPHALVVVFRDEELTYTGLNQRANQLAHHLVSLGVVPGMPVGICMERSLEMIVALMAILKAGGAYVPLDSSHPEERLAFILEDAQIRHLVAHERLLEMLPANDLAVICPDREAPAIAKERTDNLSTQASPDALAYIMYTSGSTGRPKGVLIPHRGISRLVRQPNVVKITPEDVFLQLAPISFDASTFEIWGPLLNGARLAVIPPEMPTFEQLGDFIRKRNVSILWLTAAMFHQVVDNAIDELRGVRQLWAGGEILSAPHVSKFLETHPGIRLINGYGPTENTTFTCCYPIPAAEKVGNSIPIGRPIANTRVYLLDTHLQPVPVGVPGELYAGGDGLAQGYLNGPGLTEEKFVPDPFSELPGARMYKTGDLARYHPDGNIEFLGRLDDQVKIRGFRIEPGEIEAVLSENPEVLQCAVTTQSGSTGDKSLTAFVVLRNMESCNAESLTAWLETQLPGYMIPTSFVALESLPLTKSGKIDRRDLAATEGHRLRRGDVYTPPRTELELRLVAIWREVLQQERIGIHDNFFHLGGHSLQAVKLAAEIESLLGCHLPIAVLFQTPTIESLARWLIDHNWKPESNALVPLQPKGSKPPLFLIHGFGGDVYTFVELAQALPECQPVYGLQAVGLDERKTRHTSIEQMAAAYIREIRAFQSEGPYYLAGYSMGGCIAYEIAQQLQKLGQEVGLLGLLDSSPTGRVPWSVYMRTMPWMLVSRSAFHLREISKMPGRDWTDYLQGRWAALKIRLTRNLGAKPLLSDHSPERDHHQPSRQNGDYYEMIARGYEVRPYPGSIDVFVCDNTRPWRMSSWQHLTRGKASLHRITGEHLELLKHPYVGSTAKALANVLAGNQEKQTGPGMNE